MPSTFACSFYRIFFGQSTPESESVKQALCALSSAVVDFVAIPIRRALNGRFDDLVDIRGVSSEEMGSSVVGIVSTPHPKLVGIGRIQSVIDEISWAHHAGMYAISLDVSGFSVEDLVEIFARVADSTLTRTWIACSVNNWSAWDSARRKCPHLSRASVYLTNLEITVDESVYRRWLGEPVASFQLIDSPLIEDVAHCILSLVRMNAQPIASSIEQIQAVAKFLDSASPLSWDENYAAPYFDSLQLPLQPLADDMENGVYETFEADRGKYDLYESAIFQAIQSLLSEYPHERCVRLAVVGAGRGGLIDSACRAIARVNRSEVSFSIAAVEKNPNAARTLQYRASDDVKWTGNPNVAIEIVETDMRAWNPDSPADILISELLGSLGDNEASPECINGVIRVLDPIRGVSIPHRYVSTIEPVSCARTWNAAKAMHRLEHVLVVYFNNCFKPSAPLDLFEFVHESGPVHVPGSNERSASLSWTLPTDTTIHGFAGYFHCDLFGDVVMSTHPPTRSKDMMSWFPSFLPLKEPIFVPAGEPLSVRVERKIAKEKLWLQWTVAGQSTNNADGQAYTIGL